MGAAAPIFMAGSAGLQMFGAIKQADAEARAAEENAKLAEFTAKGIESQTAENVKSFRTQTRKFLAKQALNYSANGVRIGGSAQDVMSESAIAAEIDALRMEQAGVIKAMGARMEGRLLRNRAGEIRSAGNISAVGYLLGGAGNVAEKGQQYGWFDAND